MTDRSTSDGPVAVLLPGGVPGPLDYLPPEDPAVALEPGAFVAVPLGPRTVTGVVWGPGRGDLAPDRLRPIAAIHTLPPMDRPSRAFVEWVAGYTLNRPGRILRMMMSVPEVFRPLQPVTVYRIGSSAADRLPGRLTPQRRRVLALMADGRARSTGEITRAAAVSAGVVRALAGIGALLAEAKAPETEFPEPDWRLAGPVLSPAQAEAARQLTPRSDPARVTVLDGVTGAGKTEVYFEAVAAVLAAGRQVLVLLPEIALGAQWLARFERRFGASPAAWHSDVGASRRRETWRAVAQGRARVVVGARSALFLPFRDLGLIVVDEEHDASYKQEDGVIYNARDMAVVRGRLARSPVVLVSATPSLETWRNVTAGKYRHAVLPQRFGGAAMPTVRLVDLGRDRPGRGHWLAAPLVAAATETLARDEQVLLFLNRRGYAPLTLCRACGHRWQCPNCSAWLVEHRLTRRLRCHHCDYGTELPGQCPACGEADSRVACGPGVERLAEEVTERWPDRHLAIMTSDTVTRPGDAEALIAAMQSGAIDILIGTQMVAKGHHFPNLTLVGVVDADLGLAGGDVRAGERTFQLLSQVGGRAGRAARSGVVHVQTHEPEHPVMAALKAGDRDRFFAAELAMRKAAQMPPFTRLAALILSGRSEGQTAAAAMALRRAAPARAGLRVIGPAPAPLALLRGRYRFRLLVRAAREMNLQAILAAWLDAHPLPPRVRLQIDIDPYSFF